ncbi:MAG: hypothetical protein IPN88_09720 [Bacteroidetes bacterium]|nr:hypothetical protein [Bacteroidota bacterium]
MKRSICILLFLFIANQLYAQNRFDVFYLGANENFMQQDSLKRTKNYEASLFANLSVPLFMKDSSIWITIVDYQSFSINNNYLPADSLPIDRFDLHAFIVRTGYIHRFNEAQSLQILVIPRVMTDFNAEFKNSFQLGGMVMYEKVKSKTYTYRLGLLYNQECFGPYLTPIFYLDWSITQKLKFTGMLPVYGKLYLEPSKNLSYGLHFVGLTTSYRVNENNFENYYVERNSIDVSVFSNLRIWKNVFFEARAGYSITKDYALYAEDQKVDLGLPLAYIGDTRVRSNYEYENSPFVHFRLLYSVPMN